MTMDLNGLTQGPKIACWLSAEEFHLDLTKKHFENKIIDESTGQNIQKYLLEIDLRKCVGVAIADLTKFFDLLRIERFHFKVLHQMLVDPKIYLYNKFLNSLTFRFIYSLFYVNIYFFPQRTFPQSEHLGFPIWKCLFLLIDLNNLK